MKTGKMFRAAEWGDTPPEIIELIKSCPGEWTAAARARAKKNGISDEEISSLEARSFERWFNSHGRGICRAIMREDGPFFNAIAAALSGYGRDGRAMLVPLFLTHFPEGTRAEFVRWCKQEMNEQTDDKTLRSIFDKAVKGINESGSRAD